MKITDEDYNKLKEYVIALEHTRADLWGVDEALREKIAILEAGHQDLMDHIQGREAWFDEVLLKCKTYYEDRIKLSNLLRKNSVDFREEVIWEVVNYLNQCGSGQANEYWQFTDWGKALAADVVKKFKLINNGQNK